MKEIRASLFVAVIYTLIVATLTSYFYESKIRTMELKMIGMQRTIDSLETHRDTVYLDSDWSKLIKAIIKTESNGDPNAVGKAEDVGCMQIRPIYVKEVNRILNDERYTLDDRYDPMKTLEMFHVVQNHHNPDHDIETAIRLHNKAGWYRERIINTMQKI